MALKVCVLWVVLSEVPACMVPLCNRAHCTLVLLGHLNEKKISNISNNINYGQFNPKTVYNLFGCHKYD